MRLRCCGKYVTGIGNVPKWDPPRRKKLIVEKVPVEEAAANPNGAGTPVVVANGESEAGHLFEQNA